MSTPRERQAADYTPGENSYVFDSTGVAIARQLPADMIGDFCTFTNETDSTLYVRFGAAAQTIDTAMRSAGDPPAPAANAPTVRVAVGTTLRVGVPFDATHFAMLAGTGEIRCESATGNAGNAG
ncbi:MAG: hypothetical protein AAGE52_01315 [Myxococcota bacterium]